MIPQHSNITVAWFDGAAQLDGILCGAGGVLKLPDFTVIRWVLNCGRGTNTKAELMGAWETLRLASHMSLQRLQIMGDSKVVIDWLSNRGRLQVCAIEGWKARIKDLIKSFNLVSFEHIYRNFNMDADLLSKQALGEPEGSIIFYPGLMVLRGPKDISVFTSIDESGFIFVIEWQFLECQLQIWSFWIL
jgi:ribonuclease HI